MSIIISPSKALLNFQLSDQTPAKAVVQSDLNSWLQTHKKQLQRFTPSKKYVKRYPPKHYNLQINSIQSLRIKRQMLLKLSDKKGKTLSIPSTYAGSVQSSNAKGQQFQNKNTPQTLAYKQQCNILPLLKISQFSPNELSPNQTNNRKIINLQRPLLKLHQVQQPQRMTNQIKKMQEKNRRMTKILSFNRIKNEKQNINSLKRQMMNKSVQINKGKLTANQKLALHMIARKTQNIQIRCLKTNWIKK